MRFLGGWAPAVLVAATFVLIFWTLVPGVRVEAASVDASESVVVEPGKEPESGTWLLMEATGYSRSAEEGTLDGITASGLPVARGMCAADPALLQQGSILLVDGYGYCVVGDTGAAIKGLRIDLFFPAREEALAWGRRAVKVLVVRILVPPQAR